MRNRYDQNMNRRSRHDVLEGDHGFIAVNDIGFDAAIDDPAEEAITHTRAPLFIRMRINPRLLGIWQKFSRLRFPTRHSGAQARRRGPKYSRRSWARTRHHDWRTSGNDHPPRRTDYPPNPM